MLKGNAVVGQSGGPTAAINATLAGVIRGCYKSDSIGTVYGALNGIEGVLKGDLCVLNDIVKGEDDISALAATPAAALGSCRVKLPKIDDDPSTYEKLFSFFREKNIRYFFYIGGNDSMDTVAKLSAYSKISDYEIKVMGVPKTIDNDVEGTDHTPGYGSAAKYIAASMQEIIRDTAVYKVKAVTIVEIMGRDAGWLTAAAALPRLFTDVAPDLVYLPEVAFDYEKYYEDVQKAFEKHPNVVVAVSEGVRLADGTYLGASAQSGVKDVFGHAYLSGTGKALEIATKNRLGCKVRSVELNILQRCASHIASGTDIDESLRIGEDAVSAAVSGLTGKMMVFKRVGDNPYGIITDSEDIDKIANIVKDVPAKYINERGNNVTDECLNFIAPLTFGECNIRYKNGLPVHFIIK